MPPRQQPPTLLWVNQFAVPPTDGGGTRHIEMGRLLAQRGWRVMIQASDFHVHTRRYTRRSAASDRNPVTEMIDGVELRWLWSAPYRQNNWRRALNWLTFALSVLRDEFTRPPDVVIGSSPQPFAALAAQRLARRYRVPYVLEVRDLWPETLEAAGIRGSSPRRAFRHLMSWLYGASERVVVLARGVQRHLERAGVPASKLAYVPNGVDLAAFDVPRASCARPFTLVYAGAHGPLNGLDAVLDAASKLRGHDGIRFLLVGDGPAKSGLVRSAAARGLWNVEFRDPVAKRAMPALLASADAGLMVLRESKLFSFGVSPNKLFDYLAARLPVVCNVPGEVASLLAAAGAGVQATDASGEALAKATLKLLAMPEHERRRMGESGRAWVAREHDRALLATRLDAVLRDVIAL